MIKRLKLKKADALLIAVLLLACAVLFAARGGGKGLTARVSVRGETLYAIDLKTVAAPYELPLENGVTLQVEPGGIRFSHSPCRGQDCVRCGTLTRAGQTAACLPTQTLVTITGRPPKGAPDAVSY